MILDAIINLFFALFDWLASILPTYSPDFTTLFNGFSYFWGIMWQWNDWLPVTEVAYCVGITMAILIPFYLYKFTLFVYHLIRGKA